MTLALRTRLTFWYTLIVAVLLIISAVTLFIVLQQVAANKLDSILWLIGATESEEIAARMRDRKLKDPDELTVHDIDISDLPGYEQFQLQRYVTVISQNHTVADFSINLPSQPLPFSDELVNEALSGKINFDTTTLPNGVSMRLVYVPVIGHETNPFVVVVGIPTEFVGRELKGLVAYTAIIIVIFLILSALSGWILVKLTMVPVVTTSDAVRRISGRNLHQRLAEFGTGDELDNLIKGFNQLLSRLEEAFEVQRRFTADASHEIGTPITALKGQTEVALLRPLTTIEYQTVLKSNAEEIDRLSQLVSNLLQLARGDAGEQQVGSEVLDFLGIIERNFERFKPSANEKGVELSLSINGPIYVLGDETAIDQIASNLISNALRYTPNGNVEIRVGEEPGHAFVEVNDDGIGIPEADQPHIFERFFRAGNARSRERGGSGLGLAISKMLAEALGGTLTMRSKRGEGTSFKFTMPKLHIPDDSDLD
jgi:two-component system OmpR family sensor kinase